MIKIYYSPSCSSCRKVKKWFDDQKIPYTSKDIFSGSLNEAEIRDIITKCIDGTDEIISPRSKIVQEQNINFDEMKVSELTTFIKNNPFSAVRSSSTIRESRLDITKKRFAPSSQEPEDTPTSFAESGVRSSQPVQSVLTASQSNLAKSSASSTKKSTSKIKKRQQFGAFFILQ